MLNKVAEAQVAILEIVAFIKQTFQSQGFERAVIGVSGGIDSALALTLLCQALGAEAVLPMLLPYGQQEMIDAEKILDFNQIPASNVQVINIKAVADDLLHLAGETGLGADQLRLGNIMARVRMTLIFDRAKKERALVCGTENKSEHLLAYYTRFGDSASDLEPLSHLYKTEVRLLAEALNLPQIFLDKAPSAGLWLGQSDEVELGFSYELADQVLAAHIDRDMSEAAILADENLKNLPAKQMQAVLARLKAVAFKEQVPYRI